MLQVLMTKFYEVAEVEPRRLMFARISMIFSLITLALMVIVFQVGLLADTGLIIVMVGTFLNLIARSLPQQQQPVIGHLTLGGLSLMIIGLVVVLIGSVFFILTT